MLMWLCIYMRDMSVFLLFVFFFFKQKTAYEMRISDWSSDVCSSDLRVFASSRESLIPFGTYLPIEPNESPQTVRHDGRNSSRPPIIWSRGKIGRASCRERVCQYV